MDDFFLLPFLPPASPWLCTMQLLQGERLEDFGRPARSACTPYISLFAWSFLRIKFMYGLFVLPSLPRTYVPLMMNASLCSYNMCVFDARTIQTPSYDPQTPARVLPPARPLTHLGLRCQRGKSPFPPIFQTSLAAWTLGFSSTFPGATGRRNPQEVSSVCFQSNTLRVWTFCKWSLNVWPE